MKKRNFTLLALSFVLLTSCQDVATGVVAFVTLVLLLVKWCFIICVIIFIIALIASIFKS